jgi:hypothetical protein
VGGGGGGEGGRAGGALHVTPERARVSVGDCCLWPLHPAIEFITVPLRNHHDPETPKRRASCFRQTTNKLKKPVGTSKNKKPQVEQDPAGVVCGAWL